MANIEKIVPFLILWETGVNVTGATNERLFKMAKAKGIINDPADRGGSTIVV